MEPKLNALRDAEMRDLLGAYALGAVSDEEAAAVRAFLATNPESRAEIVELWAAVDLLPALVVPMEPPPGLRDRIAAAVLADAAASSPVPTVEPVRLPSQPTMQVLPPVAEPLPAPIQRPASFWSRATPWVAAAAALLLITAGLLYWNLQLRNQIESTPPPEVIALAPTDAAPGASGEVHYSPDQQLFLLDVKNLPPLKEGQVYEVWLIKGKEAKPAGVFDQPTDQHAIVADRSRYDLLAITVEPGPLGTEVATGEIVATAPL